MADLVLKPRYGCFRVNAGRHRYAAPVNVHTTIRPGAYPYMAIRARTRTTVHGMLHGGTLVSDVMAVNFIDHREP